MKGCFFMADGFYPTNNEILKFDEKEIDKILFNHYISRKENFQRLNGELERGHFKLSARTVAEDLGIPLTKAHKLIKEFEELGIIQAIFKSKSRHKPSIYCYVAASVMSETVRQESETVKQESETVKSQKIISFDTVKKVSNDTVENVQKHDNTNGFVAFGSSVNDTVNDTVNDITSETVRQESETVNETVNETVKHDNINGFNCLSETVSKTVNETSKKELLKRKYKKSSSNEVLINHIEKCFKIELTDMMIDDLNFNNINFDLVTEITNNPDVKHKYQYLKKCSQNNSTIQGEPKITCKAIGTMPEEFKRYLV